jgi:hypothetical protein
MSYTTITTNRPGQAFRDVSSADEANALFARVMEITAKHGGETSLIGYDHARACNVAIITYPDSESAAKAGIEVEASGIIDVESRGMFSPMEDFWPVYTAALG